MGGEFTRGWTRDRPRDYTGGKLWASLACGAAALLFIASVRAATEVVEFPGAPVGLYDARQGSLLFKTEHPGVFLPAPTLNTRAHIRVTGMVARARVSQRFHNPTGQWVEGVYVFPLPDSAAVDGLRMRIGERIVEAVVKERAEAKQIYAQAKQEGRRAALLDQERPNIFTNSVANIGPGESVTVEIEYQQVLRYDDGRFDLRFPMVVAPRYIPGSPAVTGDVGKFDGTGWADNTGQVPDASRITPPVQHPRAGALSPVSLTVEVDAGFPLAHIDSPYHGIEVQREGPTLYRVTLAGGAVPANRDFELVWAPEVGDAPSAALFTERRSDGVYGLLMLMPPTRTTDGAVRLARETIFVIDQSGSMHGTSIAQAKKALVFALGRLAPRDHFNVIAFNHAVRRLFGNTEPASRRNVDRALGFVESLNADGGTEMEPPLLAALDGDAHPNHVRQVVFITDGAVGNEQRLFGLIRERLGDSRLFPVAIGPAPNSYLMTRAADLGRGTFTHIGKTEEVQEKMTSLYRKLESPVLTDIRVQWPPDTRAEAWPAALPDIYLGEPVVLSARLDKAGGSVRISGSRAGEPWERRLPLQGGMQTGGIAKLWAREKIRSLMDAQHDGAAEESVRQSILEVALTHQLVSKYTSLVAVDRTPTRPDNLPVETRPLPVNLPDGMTYEKVFGGLPQTATGADRHLLLGLVLLIVGLLGYRRLSRQRWHRDACAH